MSEDNVRKEIQLPYMTFGSDEASMAPEGIFLKSSCHPRAYGNFANLLGTYVRDEKLITLEDAIHKLSGMPAELLHLKKRGELKTGNYADIVVFDPATIRAHSTYEKPHQLATGVSDVFVNGTQVLKGGAHTGAKPGRVVYGAGYKGILKIRLHENCPHRHLQIQYPHASVHYRNGYHGLCTEYPDPRSHRRRLLRRRRMLCLPHDRRRDPGHLFRNG